MGSETHTVCSFLVTLEKPEEKTCPACGKQKVRYIPEEQIALMTVIYGHLQLAFARLQHSEIEVN